ncbi:MAG TPA: ATP-binding protein [Candidatus Baltobacteraceae bacterium]|nr:ATP-binding protein [Candidatus Baltobacteraceae bacterium]
MQTHTNARSRGEKRYTLKLAVPPDPQFAATVRNALTGFAQLHGVSAYDVEPLVCALGEALANAIEHAATAHDLEIEAEVDADWIVASIRDRGRGLPAIPIENAPLPRALAERGRGIPMMQRCTDVFSVESEPGAGTTIRLGRYRLGRTERGHTL